MPSPEVLRWYYFIPRSGAEGQRWYEEYRSADCTELTAGLDNALGLLRRRDIGAGQRLLAACEHEIRKKRERIPPLVVRVLERWYLSTLAYAFYAVGDYERATEHLDLARDAIADAIGSASYLIVLATSCCEFNLHHARIARSQRHWATMQEQLHIARAMVSSRWPLCRLASGREIFLADVDDFFRSISPADDEEREALAFLVNAETRWQGFEHTVRTIQAIPNVVIPYP